MSDTWLLRIGILVVGVLLFAAIWYFGPREGCAAVERAWELATDRVWVHTCTLDHPSALPNYRARGFRIYDALERTARLPSVKPTPWPAASRR